MNFHPYWFIYLAGVVLMRNMSGQTEGHGDSYVPPILGF